MDPLSQLTMLHHQDSLPVPKDLSKQISKSLDPVKKNLRRSNRISRVHGICSHSEVGYKSACAPLNTSECFTHLGGEQRKLTDTGLHDASSSHSQFTLPTVETLSSECSASRYVEYVSSEDSSSVIEVPMSIPTSNLALTKRMTANEKLGKERIENSSPSVMELDLHQDSDLMDSRNITPTSEAENADFFKPTLNGCGSSSSSSSQMSAPATKKNMKKNQPRIGQKAKANAAKRRKKKQQRSGLFLTPPAFSSHEPEIRLKYASCKEKRESRASTFAPYVHMDFSTCTVVNFQEDGEIQMRKYQQPALSPGIIPTTSCLQLGRLRSEGRRQTGELCCLCGQPANTASMGDLHGPYHPCRSDRKTSADFLLNGHEDAGAKGKQMSDEVEGRWVHEDCSIWSADVFLVKGRLYGLDEAVAVAQQAVCSCCHRRGATLGCFYRGCVNKYHFPCALQTGCGFNEENFTLRCPKHTNKPGLVSHRLQDRGDEIKCTAVKREARRGPSEGCCCSSRGGCVA